MRDVRRVGERIARMRDDDESVVERDGIIITIIMQ